MARSNDFNDNITNILNKMKDATTEGTEVHGDEFYSVHRVQVERLERILGPVRGMMPIDPKDDRLQQFLKGVDGVVECTREEYYAIWNRNDKATQHKKSWVSESFGIGECVGYLAGHGIHVMLQKATIDDQLILFVEATSNVVDHNMVREWVSEAMNKFSGRTKGIGPGSGDEWRWSDATNWHNVLR